MRPVYFASVILTSWGILYTSVFLLLSMQKGTWKVPSWFPYFAVAKNSWLAPMPVIGQQAHPTKPSMVLVFPTPTPSPFCLPNWDGCGAYAFICVWIASSSQPWEYIGWDVFSANWGQATVCKTMNPQQSLFSTILQIVWEACSCQVFAASSSQFLQKMVDGMASCSQPSVNKVILYQGWVGQDSLFHRRLRHRNLAKERALPYGVFVKLYTDSTIIFPTYGILHISVHPVVPPPQWFSPPL